MLRYIPTPSDANEVRPATCANWLKSEAMIASKLFIEMAAKIPEGNVSALQAPTAHMEVLMRQITALEYISRLFGDQQDDACSASKLKRQIFST